MELLGSIPFAVDRRLGAARVEIGDGRTAAEVETGDGRAAEIVAVGRHRDYREGRRRWRKSPSVLVG